MTSQQPKRTIPWRTICLAANVAALAAFVVWAVFDPYFAAWNEMLFTELGLRPGKSVSPLERSWSRFGAQLLAIECLMALAFATSLATFLLLFIGPSRQRGARAWLTVITLCSAWLALATGWKDLAWWGDQQRARRQLPGFVNAAKLLENRWPGQDGELAGFGVYNAYPIGAPSMLMMLEHPTNPDRPRFNVVERAPSGALRFGLLNGRDWLEWHPPGHTPQSFTGGLEDRHKLIQAAALGEGWHLARYQPDFGDAQ